MRHHQNQTTNNIPHPVLNDRGLGNGGSFKIAAHFPLWLETNCCNHRIQNEREARHKNAGTNSLVTAKLTELYYLSARPCWKLAVFQIILFFYDGLRQHLAVVFYHKCKKKIIWTRHISCVHILGQLQLSRCLVLIIYSCDRKCGLGSWKNIKANSITPFHGAFPQMLNWFWLYWNLIVRKLCQEYYRCLSSFLHIFPCWPTFWATCEQA